MYSTDIECAAGGLGCQCGYNRSRDGYELNDGRHNCTGTKCFLWLQYNIMLYYKKMSMNVTNKMVVVLTIAAILKEVLNVHATLAIN